MANIKDILNAGGEGTKVEGRNAVGRVVGVVERVPVEYRERIAQMAKICNELGVTNTGFSTAPGDENGPVGMNINNISLIMSFLDDFDNLPDDTSVKIAYARIFSFAMNLHDLTRALVERTEAHSGEQGNPQKHGRMSQQEIMELIALTKAGDKVEH